MKESWHEQWYDTEFAKINIDSVDQHKLAKKEVQFILDVAHPKMGSKILDVPCGSGRHALNFAKHGFPVTGVDISRDCLELARENCVRLNVELNQGNMIKLSKYKNQFDLTVNLFTSFGYFPTDAENEEVMKQLVSTLKPGGSLALRLINRQWLLKVFRPVQWSENKDSFIMEGRQMNIETFYNESNLIIIKKCSGQAKRYYHRIRCYSKSEVVALMEKFGLRKIQVFGGIEGQPFHAKHSTHPVYFGVK